VFGLVEVAEKLGLSEAEQGRLEELRARSTRELARISFQQAKFSESTGDLAAAMQHVERACRYETDDAECWDAAARLALRLGRELHRARDAALRAIRLAPQTIGYRITLIRVYLAAGLVKNARREAEAALAIKPDDKQLKALLAEARAQDE
jgi:tetratricopeptide (TPR) repeat protein